MNPKFLINEEITKIVRKLNAEILAACDCKVISFQFVAIEDSDARHLISYTYAHKIQTYSQATKTFIGLNNDKTGLSRSLLFLEFNRAYKYSLINAKNTKEKKLDYHFESPLRIGDLDSVKKSSQNLEDEKRDKLWEEWIEILSSLGYGSSIIWTNLNVKLKFQKPIHTTAFIVFDTPLDESNVKESISTVVKNFLYEYIINLHVLKIEHQHQQLSEQGIRTAFAELNVRTTSHNTGSHILSNEFEEDKTVTTKDYADFRIYMRQRMLYNADIVSGKAPFFATGTLGEIAESFEELKIVTRYISGYHNKVFKGFFPYKEDYSHDESVMDIPISIPGGNVGFHAFYVIWENLIRNYFKHGGKGNSICIGIEKVKESNKYIWLKLATGSVEVIERNEKKIITKSVFVPDQQSAEIFKIVNSLLHQQILNEKKVLRKNGRGLLEMKGAAMYINGIAINNINNLHNTCFHTTFNESKSFIEYHLRIKKHRHIAFATINEKIENNHISNSLPRLGYDDSSLREYEFILTDNIDQTFLYNEKSQITPHVFSVTSIAESYKSASLLKGSTGADIILEYLLRNQITETQNKLKSRFIIGEMHGDRMTYYHCEKNSWNPSSKEPGEKTILFDSHGNNIQKYLSEELCDIYYYEPFNSHSFINTTLLDASLRNLKLYNELLLAATCSIIVIDERIQKLIDKNSEFDQPGINTIKSILNLTKVYVPTTEQIDLNATNIHQDKATSLAYLGLLKYYLETNNADYILLHYGIIERFVKVKSRNNIQAWIEEYIESCFDNKVQVILHSERGGTPTVPFKYRYLHYSNIERFLIYNRSKLHLFKTILSSRNNS
jgi:hypothetical protein